MRQRLALVTHESRTIFAGPGPLLAARRRRRPTRVRPSAATMSFLQRVQCRGRRQRNFFLRRALDTAGERLMRTPARSFRSRRAAGGSSSCAAGRRQVPQQGQRHTQSRLAASPAGRAAPPVAFTSPSTPLLHEVAPPQPNRVPRAYVKRLGDPRAGPASQRGSTARARSASPAIARAGQNHQPPLEVRLRFAVRGDFPVMSCTSESA